MITGTVFLSKKVKAILGNDAIIFTKAIDELIEKTVGYKATVDVADSHLHGADVSVNLIEVNNISGTRSDFVSAAIKVTVTKFFIERSLVLNPLNIKVVTQGANVF